MVRTRARPVWLRLLGESRQAALNAIQTFNNPLKTFKTQTFIVLMVIAWRSLLHAYYRRQGVEYRYFDQGPKRRRFHRRRLGAYRYWELDRCLNDRQCPLDTPTKINLRFLIGLRNEIEHHESAGVDEAFTGRYLACCLNFEREITSLFGDRHSLAHHISYALQLRDLNSPSSADEQAKILPRNVESYVSEVDAETPADEYQHPHFSYRVIFVPKLTNNPSQSDRAIEFVGSGTDLAAQTNKEYWVQKEVERPKHLPGQIVGLMREEGYAGFNMHHHTQLWRELDARKPANGYGVQVAGNWYWYGRWVDVVREHCAENRGLYTT